MTSSSLGHDGRVWFALADAAQTPVIESIDDAGIMKTTELPSNTAGRYVADMAVTKNGTVWVNLACIPGISDCKFAGYGIFGPAGVGATRFAMVGRPDAKPEGIALAPDGSAWIAEAKANAIVRVGVHRELKYYPLRNSDAQPSNINVDPDGTVRFLEASANSVGTIDARGRVTEKPLPARNSRIVGLAVDPRGRVWYSEIDADNIAAVDPAGHVREYHVPTPDAQPAAVTIDPRGNVWFVEYNTYKLGRIGSDGTIEESYLPNELGQPLDVIAGPGDLLYVFGLRTSWFGMIRNWAVARIPESSAIR